jgi:hypothetical protein
MAVASELMAQYIARTTRAKRRYLWTDAFAVCNLIGLGDLDGALALVELVHAQLGHRDAHHPTRHGLRIGKPLPERAAGELLDEATEWDRDGQYFHYLTKWMHALDQVARATGDAKYCIWSRELANVAFRRFVYRSHGVQRMYWKMSVDLSRPQVTSMGHHDPLDGYVTCLQLDATARAFGVTGPDLKDAIAAYRGMIQPRGLATSDGLGLGGLLVDSYRLTQLNADRELRDALLASARVGLQYFVDQGDLELPASQRLAFRELGLAIGLSSTTAMAAPERYAFGPLADEIRGFWSDATHRSDPTYLDHQDINDVMLATSISPNGFLVLRPPVVSERLRVGA